MRQFGVIRGDSHGADDLANAIVSIRVGASMAAAGLG